MPRTPIPSTKPRFYPDLYLAQAVIGGDTTHRNLLDLALALDLPSDNGLRWNAARISEFVKNGRRHGWWVDNINALRIAGEHRLPAVKQLLTGGQLPKWCYALLRYLNVIADYERRPSDPDAHYGRYFSYPSHDTLLAGVRIAVLARDQACLDKAQSKLGSAAHETLRDAFRDYVDAELIEYLPQPLQPTIVSLALMDAMRNPTPELTSLIDWGAAKIDQGAASPEIKYAVTKQTLWRGQFARAEAWLQGDHSEQALALQADAAAMQGHFARALDLYEQAIDAARVETRVKYGLLAPSSAWLRVAAMIAVDDPTRLKPALTLLKGEAKQSRFKWLWSGLEHVIEVRLGNSAAQALWLTFGNDLFTDFANAIAHAWLKRKLDQHSLRGLNHWERIARDAGYEWLANELFAAYTIANGGNASGSFANAFAQEAGWQRALTMLATLGDEGSKQDATDETRLVWVLTDINDDADDMRVPHIEAYEQKRGPRGFTRGKKISWTKLADNQTLDAHNARVALCLERLTANTFDIDRHRAIRALVGHPLVFFADNLDTPVELELAEPQLIVSKVDGKNSVRLSLSPTAQKILSAFGEYQVEDSHFRMPLERHAAPCLFIRHAEARAGVIPLTPAHRRVAKLIGAQLDAPESAAEHIAKAVQGVDKHFVVHSSVQGHLAEAAADAVMRAELTPLGAGLRLNLAMRPFGNSGPRHLPGRGGVRAFAKVDGQSKSVVRDLAAEKSVCDDVLDQLLAFDVDEHLMEAHVAEPEHCLELIETLQSLHDKVRIEWPAGAKFSVSRSYAPQDLKLSLNRKRDWFMADGGLQLDDGTVLSLRRLIDAARTHRGRYVPLGEGGYVALSEALHKQLDELALLDEARDGAAQLPLTAALAIADCAENTQLTVDTDFGDLRERIDAAQSLDPAPPSTLQAELRSYQLDGFKWLMRLAHWGGGACLADDMGLGKTLQSIAVLAVRADQGPALVVAPTSVCQNWMDEMRRFAPTLNATLYGGAARSTLIDAAAPFDVLVCSYTLLQQDIDAFKEKTWRTLVLDEAQAVKNFATKRAQAVLSLSADFRVAATGTPVENRLEELWMLFRFLNPGLLGSRERFNERFAGPIENGDAAVRAHLRRFIAPFVLRRTKSEVLTELPPRTEITLTVEPDEGEQAFHEALRQSALDALSKSDVPAAQRRFQVLAELMRVRRACCDPSLVTPGVNVGSAKLDAFADLVKELIANRHKALVFSQFVDYLSILKQCLDSLGIRYQYLDGSTPAAERAQRVQAFQRGEGELFLISLRAGGVGLNLTAADYVIITDPWWNPAVEDQAASRAHRMGQDRPVTVYRLVLKNSIEERITQLHHEKRALAEGLFTGEEFGGAMSVDDLVGLLRNGA